MNRVQTTWGYALVSVVVLSVVAFLVMRAVTPFGSATSPDSISYLDVAAHVKQGQGQVTTDFSLSQWGASALRPQRIWPPAYQWVLAKAIADPFDVVGTAKLSTGLLFLTGLLVLMLLRQARTDWLIVLSASVLIMVTLPVVLVYTYAWSETLFLPLLLAMMGAGGGYLTTPAHNRWGRVAWLFFCVCLAMLLAMTRYIGVAMMALWPLLFLLGKRDRWAAVWMAGFGAVYTGVIGCWLWQNLQLTGSLSGGARAPAVTGFTVNVQHLAEAVVTLFPVSVVGFGVALVVAGAAWYGIYASGYAWVEKETDAPRRTLSVWCLSAALWYLLALLLMRSHSQFDDIDVRLIAPAIPLLWVVLVMAPGCFTPRSRASWGVALMSLFLVFAWSARGYDRLSAASINWAESGSPNLPMRGTLKFNNFTPAASPNPAVQFLQTLVEPGGVLVMERPLLWRFMTRLALVQKPSGFDAMQLLQLNRLPSGSVMILSGDEFGVLRAAVEQAGWVLHYQALGDSMAVKLPFITTSIEGE